MVFFRFPFHSGIQHRSFDNDTIASSTIYQTIASYLGSSDFSLVYNGRVLPEGENVPQDANILVTFSLPGGKGGFGSMLRAIGAQIEKTTNREACRDLSGRRLRDINEEQRLKKWISKESEREVEKARRRKERIERLKSKPKHNFNDFEYEKKLSEGPDRVEEALAAGIEKRSKRSTPQAASCSAVRPKKQRLWLDEDISGSSSSDIEEGDSPSTSCTATPAEEAGCSSWTGEHTTPQDSGDSSDSKPLVENSPSQEPSATESSGKLATESSEQSVAESSESSAAESSEKSAAESSEKSAAESSEKSAAESSEKSAAESSEKSAAESSELSAAESSEQSAAESSEKSAVESSEQFSAELNVGGDNTSNPVEVLSSAGNDSSSSDQEKSSKDLSSNDRLSAIKITNEVDTSPIDLMSFEGPSSLEALGLDRLKWALTERGLKCGGTARDRAQRLWVVRGLQPHQYPLNLVAKKKK